MPLADAHIHLFASGFQGRHGRPSSGGNDLAVYEGLRHKHGITRALVVGYEGVDAYVGNNNYIADLSHRHDWIAPTAFLSVWPPPDRKTVEDLAAAGFCGVVLYLRTPDDASSVSAWPREVIDQISRRYRVISLNATASATAGLAGVIGRLQPSTVLFSHLGLPGRFVEPPSLPDVRERLGPLLELAAMEHVGVKVSACHALREPPDAVSAEYALPVINALLEQFGAERLYWGSDFSPSLDWVPYSLSVDIPLPGGLSPREVSQIMGGNLLRLLHDHRR